MVEQSRRFTILAVDDSEMSLAHLQNMLSKDGYVVATAPGGAEALAFVEQRVPDLILLDIVMPRVNGFDVIRKLKAMPRTAQVPVIFLTSNEDEDSKMTAFSLGAVDYVVKPFNPQEVRARVRVHLKITVALQDAVESQAEKIRQIQEAQRSLFIRPEDLPAARFSVFCRSVVEAGGDFYDIVDPAEGIFTYLVADVSGHDIATSYIHPALKALFRQNSSPLHTLAETATMMNKVLEKIVPPERYLSAFFLSVNRNAGRMSWISAGHPPALFIPVEGAPSFLEGEDELIGVNGSSLYHASERSVREGDRVILYTDGLVERSAGTSVWGAEYRTLLPFAQGLRGVPLGEAPRLLVERYFPDIEKADDDIIVLCVDI